MSIESTPVVLSATEVSNVLAGFTEGDDVIARRVFTVGGLCTKHGITPKDVFSQVQARLELTAGTDDAPRVGKGWSSSSIANAKTAFDLYMLTGVSLSYGKKSDRDFLAGLVEDVRRLHGAKTVKATLVDATAQWKDDVAADERYSGIVNVLKALKGIPADDKDKTPKTAEERFLAALAAAVNLLESVELSEEQAQQAADFIATLADAGI